MAQPIRIQKALSDAGILSRRKAEEYIAHGRITVNGHKATPGNPVNPARDVVAIDGQRVIFPRKKENVYLMLNKPRGYVTTNDDDLGRRCVAELVEDVGTRVYPVGRLDRDSEGLLLFTNDGQFANLIMHPSHHVGKTYRVTVRPGINDDQAAHLSAGVDLGNGETSAPATVLVLEKEPGRVVLQITINEGKNREIRRMCEGVGLEVARLKRVAVGPLHLGMLQPGKWRELKKSEVIALKNAARPASQQEPLPQDDGPAQPVGSFGKPMGPKGPARGRGGRPARPAREKGRGTTGSSPRGGAPGPRPNPAAPKSPGGRSRIRDDSVYNGASTRPKKRDKTAAFPKGKGGQKAPGGGKGGR